MEDMRDRVIKVLIQQVRESLPIAIAVSDSTSTSKVAPFLESFPERVIEVGIAEQCLVGVAAGLSLGGYIAYTANAANFLLARSAEQVRNDICYSDLNVKMLGLNAGVAYSTLGSTHHSIEDIGLLRSWGNVKLFAPADANEAEAVVEYASRTDGPVYIRMDSGKLPNLHEGNDWSFCPGEPVVYSAGKELAIFALGSLVHEALEALESGLDASVVNLLSLRPLNKVAIAQIIGQYKAVLCVEEHSVNTGLGSIISTIMAEHGLSARFKSCGIPEGEFAHADPRKDIRRACGIDRDGILHAAKTLGVSRAPGSHGAF